MVKVILIKPASSLCNLQCSYCFYEDVSNNRAIKNYGLMKDEVTEKIIDDALLLPYKEIVFAFQGGEPLTIGYEYYQRFIDYVNSKITTKKISYTIQTNGTLLNEKYCKLFKENNFLVGISIDGFQTNHDRFRFINKTGSFSLVMEKVRLLRDYKIDFNVLTVLTKQLAKYPVELFDFYLENQFNYVQIIPCIKSISCIESDDLYALSAKQYQMFCTLFFDRWLRKFEEGIYLSINIFDNTVIKVLGKKSRQCGFFCGCHLQGVIESNGDIFPCDFYVLDKYRQGNIFDGNLEMVLKYDNAEFIQKENTSQQCLICKYHNNCEGYCKRLESTYLDGEICVLRSLYELVSENFDRVLLGLEKAN